MILQLIPPIGRLRISSQAAPRLVRPIAWGGGLGTHGKVAFTFYFPPARWGLWGSLDFIRAACSPLLPPPASDSARSQWASCRIINCAMQDVRLRMSDRMSDRMPEHMWCDNLMWCFYHGSALLVCFKSIACFFFKTIAYCFFCEMVDLYEDWQTICQNRCLEMPWWRSLEVKWADMQNVQITKVPCFFFSACSVRKCSPRLKLHQLNRLSIRIIRC